MNEILSFAGDYWWLAFPLSGVFAIWGKSWSDASERRHKRRMEMYSLKNYGVAQAPGAATIDGSPAADRAITSSPGDPPTKLGRDLAHVQRNHDDVDRRWLAYELDAAKLIDFPMMTDVREPLTVAFLRARREAEARRPLDVDSVSSEDLADYRSAVTAYDVAFHIAETEARRLRSSGFSEAERQRLHMARTLVTVVVDDAATAAERQTAYRRARKELDGLIVLPDRTVSNLEERVAGALEARSGSAKT